MLSSLPLSNSLPVFSISPPLASRVRFRPPLAGTSTATFTSKQQKAPASGYLSRPGTASCTSLYDALEIPVGASNQEVKASYRRLARICHPDVAAIDQKDSSAYEFTKIHAAYSTLSDPVKRAVYDSKLMWIYQRPLTSAGYSGRNWETDQCW